MTVWQDDKSQDILIEQVNLGRSSHLILIPFVELFQVHYSHSWSSRPLLFYAICLLSWTFHARTLNSSSHSTSTLSSLSQEHLYTVFVNATGIWEQIVVLWREDLWNLSPPQFRWNCSLAVVSISICRDHFNQYKCKIKFIFIFLECRARYLIDFLKMSGTISIFHTNKTEVHLHWLSFQKLAKSVENWNRIKKSVASDTMNAEVRESVRIWNTSL